jgi:uncharacterized protein with FMN-binding domain
MKNVFKWVMIVIIAIIVLFLISIPILNRGMGEIKALTINPVDLFSLSDGIYTGNYCKGRWCYTVDVEVRTHQIVDIKIVNAKMNALKKVNNELIKRILEKRQVTVDTYTGATVTSKALLKAVENALIDE